MTATSTPHRCPVCLGARQVSPALYGQTAGTGTGLVDCRTCNGTGVVWSIEVTLPPPAPDPPVVYKYGHPPDCRCSGCVPPWQRGNWWTSTSGN